MAKDLKFTISAGVERAEQEVRKLQATGQQVASILERDFEQLGARSTVAIEAQRAAYVASYERIKNSGVATWQEIQAAHASMTVKVAALDATLDPVAAKFARIDEQILVMAGRGEAAVDRLSNSFQQLGIRSTASIQEERAAAVAAYQQIEASGVATWQEIQTAHAAMVARVKALDLEAQFGRGASGVKTLRQNLDDVGTSLNKLKPGVVSLVASLAAFYAGSKLWEGFRSGIKSVDDFDQAIVKTAALITTLQTGKDIASDYERAKVYAQGLNDELMRIDSRTTLNLTNLQDITEEMVKQGVVLDYTNKEQLSGFTNIANAVAVYSANGAKEAQLRQEIAALLRGEVNQNSQLASMLQRTVDGPLQKYVEQWKQSGTFVQEVGARLKGFGPAADDLAESWGAVKSSFETAMSLVLRAGFTDIVKEIAGWLGKINEYLKTHREELGGKIKEGWETAKSLISGAATVAKAVYDNFEPFAALFIGGALIGGVTRLVSLFGTLRDIVISTRAAMIGLGMVGAGTGAAVGGTAAAGAAAAGAAGTALAYGGAGVLGLGLGYAAQPLVRWADRKLYQNFGINLTGEEMNNEQGGRSREADQRWEFFQAEHANSPRNRAAGSVTIPKLNLGENQEQIKDKLELQAKELAAFKAEQEAQSSVAKDQGGIRLSILRSNYELGLVSTRAYYQAEKDAAMETAQSKVKSAAEYLRKEEDLLNLIGSKKGTSSPEYQSELAKHSKAVSEMQSAQLEFARASIDSDKETAEALHKRDETYEKLRASVLDGAGEYVESERQKQSMDDKSIDMLRLRKDAEEGVQGAVDALAIVEKRRAADLAAASVKEREAARQYTNEIAKMKDEVDALNGKDKEVIKTESDLRDGLSKEVALRDKLQVAWAAGNKTAITGLSAEIDLQQQLNQRLQDEINLRNRKGELTGAIVGYNGNTPIYADGYTKQQAATGYVSNSQLLGNAGTTVSYSGSSPFVSLNSPSPFALDGQRASGGSVSPYGTYLVGELGPEIIKMGSQGGNVLSNSDLQKQIDLTRVLAGEQRRLASMQQYANSIRRDNSYLPSPSVGTSSNQPAVTPVAITVNILGGGTTQATAKELARQVVTEINELNRRKRAA